MKFGNLLSSAKPVESTGKQSAKSNGIKAFMVSVITELFDLENFKVTCVSTPEALADAGILTDKDSKEFKPDANILLGVYGVEISDSCKVYNLGKFLSHSPEDVKKFVPSKLQDGETVRNTNLNIDYSAGISDDDLTNLLGILEGYKLKVGDLS